VPWTSGLPPEGRSWARAVFARSLLVVTLLGVMMAIDYGAHPAPASVRLARAF